MHVEQEVGAAHNSSLHLRRGVVLTLAFVVAELIAGWLANSLALLSDAAHNFADAAALGLSWYALAAAKKPAHERMTYGYHRVSILIALLNAVSLIVIALVIGWEGVQRLRHPEPVRGGLMACVAVAAVGINLLISAWLHHGAKHDINVRSAYLHMLGDAASAVGVVVAGLIVLLTGAHAADAIVSFVIAALILWSSWDILRESVDILLEGTPRGMDTNAILDAIAAVPGVAGAHDLHIWTLGPGVIAASVHILVAEQSVRDGQKILRDVVQMLQERFSITHTTVQIEADEHGAGEHRCSIDIHP